jgi:hypothetical protein
MAIVETTFRLSSLSPLLMHNPTGMEVADGQSVKTQRKIPTPEEEARAGLYRRDGVLFLPTIAFRNSLISAGTGKKIGKMSAIKALSAGVFNLVPRIELRDPATGKTLAETAYSIFICRVVLKNRGTAVAVMRSRPEIAGWTCDLPLQIDTDFITAEQVLELFGLGGRMIGVGDWRPEKKGAYGRYKAEIVD